MHEFLKMPRQMHFQLDFASVAVDLKIDSVDDESK
jgi:hypothetical protein